MCSVALNSKRKALLPKSKEQEQEQQEEQEHMNSLKPYIRVTYSTRMGNREYTTLYCCVG